MTDTTGLADALDANQQGRLSAQQLHVLESQARWRSRGLVGHALHSRDSFAKDVRAGQVDSIEGAITKKMLTDFTIEYAPPSYRIWVANRQAGKQEFHSPADIYESAPDAGMVQLFYLPRSRWVVNLECLPDAPVESLSLDAVKRTLLGELTAWAGRDKVGTAEARAELAAMGRQWLKLRRSAG